MFDARDLAVTPVDSSPGTYTGTITPFWCFDDRAFGGFSAALALHAVLVDVGRPVLTSAAVAFLEPGQPGEVTIDVVRVREGRTAALAQATMHQDGRPMLLVTAWLADAWLPETTHPTTAPFGAGPPAVPPAEGTPADWLAAGWPMLGFAERRGVVYPSGFDTFHGRPPEVALWARVVEDESPAATRLACAQLADVLHLDAHLFDAPGQITGFGDPALPDGGGVSMLSLDLTIAWQPGAADLPAGAWRLLEARGSVAAKGVTSYGSVRREDGALVAMATSQGLIRQRPPATAG